MAQTINTNVASLTAQRNLNASQGSLATSLQRLSSGLRINSAKDDAAGLAISERFSTQIRGLNQATRNANDGISLAQTAEGALSEVGNNLQRIRELTVQAANATNSTSDREALQAEVDQLVAEIDRVASNTEFNGTRLLDGSFAAQKFQVGANAGQQITIDKINSAKASELGAFNGFTLTNQSIGTASNSTDSSSVKIGSKTYDLGEIAVDAKAIASAINSAGVPGLTASANETKVGAAATQSSNITDAGTATVDINGLKIEIAATLDAGTNRANAVTAINAQSAVTGVRATDTGSGVELVAADGRNIEIDNFAEGTATDSTIDDFGLKAEDVYGATLEVSYKAPSGSSGSVEFTGSAVALATQTIKSTGVALNAIDITSPENTTKVLNSLDAALESISASRAELGALQNRFSSTIANLQTTSENLSASRGRILDADFAQETANLTRGQILQQAGTAMLAQANGLPQNVLSLLRG